MKGNVKTTFFNGIKTETLVDVEISFLRINKKENKSDDFSLKLNEDVNALLKKHLDRDFPPIVEYEFRFRIISPQLEKLRQLSADIESEDLAEITAAEICAYILKENEIFLPVDKVSGSFKDFYFIHVEKHDFGSLLRRKIENFDQNENKYVKEMDFHLLKRNYTEANRVKDLIEPQKLNSSDSLLYTRNCLKLKYNTEKNSLIQNQNEFQSVSEKFGYNKEFSLQIHLDYLKYLEDVREVKTPKGIIEKIEKTFDLQKADDDQKAYFYYLKGRQSYGRGHFIEALNFLSTSFDLYKKLGMEEETGNVFNTTVNCYNDNFYFEEAEYLANNALQIRKKYNSAAIGDTYGALGGVKFKKGDFKGALDCYNESYKILSQSSENNLRTFNYIAKCYIFLKDYDNAQQYLEKSEKLFDVATEKDKSFTHLYKLILSFMKNDDENFRQDSLIFHDPKNYFNFDHFPMGWAFTFIALNSYKKGEIEKGHKQLSQAIRFFMEDSYYFEAGYVWLYNLLNEPADYSGKPFEEDPLTFPKFVEYVELHGNLRENFAIFEEKNEETSNIIRFRDGFLQASNIKNKADQKELIIELMKKVWLF
jgi:hypothetical protein